jgi:hypothetical protein
MDKKHISPVVIVSLLVIALSLLTAGILLYTSRLNNELAVPEPTVLDPLPPLDSDTLPISDQIPEATELTDESSLESTPLTTQDGQVDIETQIRAIEQELNAIDENLYQENNINNSELGL